MKYQVRILQIYVTCCVLTTVLLSINKNTTNEAYDNTLES